MGTHARQRLVRAAEELFYAEGIRAVGVDRLLSVSGVGRASFYRHFASKDDLVVAMLRGYGERWLQWLDNEVTERGGDPLVVFDALAQRHAAPDFRGCALINAMVELADPDTVGYRVAVEHKQLVVDYLDGLLRLAGRADHAALAEQFMQLIDGAIVTALRERSAEPARRARSMAALLLG
jgi:AcrR family transcriptional regulator